MDCRAITTPSGLRIKSAMTVRDAGNDGPGLCGAGDFRFLALLGMTRCRGFLAVTLTFDSSPIKGEGILSVVLSCP